MTDRWLSAEARELAANVGVPDPEEAVRVCARRLLEEHAGGAVPVQLHALFKWGGIRKVRSENMTLEGALRRLDDGRFDVVVREDAPATRQRFSVAHELGHILFYTHAPRAKRLQVERGVHAPQEEERLCNVAAEELLMPLPIVREALAGDEGADGILKLASVCDVSVEAALVRLAPLWRGRGEIQLWQMRDSEWKPILVRRLGRSRTSLESFGVDEWAGRRVPSATNASWRGSTNLYSREQRTTMTARTTVCAIARRVPTLLISHELQRSPKPVSRETDLERAALAQARRAWLVAWKTAPLSDCPDCRGEGVIYPAPEKRLEPSRLCTCRYRSANAALSK